MKTLIKLLCIVSLAYLSALTYLYFKQESLLFLPEKLSSDYRSKLENVHEVFIDVPNARLSALYFKNENPAGVVFFLHGNSGNLSTWLTDTSLYKELNYDLFMIDYRGYGKSTDHIKSEEELFSDVKASWDYISPHYKDLKKIIYGRSLGTALAAKLSTETKPDLTILVSPYYSMDALREIYYSWVPSFLIRYKLDTAEYLSNLDNKIIILHGDKDRLIPLSQSKELEKLNMNTKLFVIEEAGHNDIHNFKEYKDILREVILK